MKKIIQQIINFAAVGIIATILDYLFFVLFFNIFHQHYIIATIIAFILSTVFNYWASIRYVFNSRFNGREKIKEFIIFLCLSVLGLSLATFLMRVTVDYINVHPNFAKLLVTGAVMILNFVTRKIFIEGITDRKRGKDD